MKPVCQTFIKPKIDLDAKDATTSEHSTYVKGSTKTKCVETSVHGSTGTDDAQAEQVKTPSGHKREV